MHSMVLTARRGEDLGLFTHVAVVHKGIHKVIPCLHLVFSRGPLLRVQKQQRIIGKLGSGPVFQVTTENSNNSLPSFDATARRAVG